jgi:hypothetical protein
MTSSLVSLNTYHFDVSSFTSSCHLSSDAYIRAMVSDTKSGGGLRGFAAGDAERGVLGIAEPEADAGPDELRDQKGRRLAGAHSTRL